MGVSAFFEKKPFGWCSSLFLPNYLLLFSFATRSLGKNANQMRDDAHQLPLAKKDSFEVPGQALQ